MLRKTATFSRKALGRPVRLTKNAECWLLLPQPWEARFLSRILETPFVTPARLFKAPVPQVSLPSLPWCITLTFSDFPDSNRPPLELLPIPRMVSQGSFPHPHPSPPSPGAPRTQSKLLSRAFQAQPPSQQTPLQTDPISSCILKRSSSCHP